MSRVVGAHRRPRARPWLVVLTVLLLAASCVAAGLSAVRARRTLESVHLAQSRAVTIARAEVASGECVSAQAHLRLATSRFARSAVRAEAARLRSACAQLSSLKARVAAAQRKGDVAGIVTANLDYLKGKPAKDLADQARSAILSALDDGYNVRALPVPVCRRMGELASGGVFAVRSGDLIAARVYASCAQAWQLSGDDAQTAASLTRLRRTLSRLVGVPEPRPVRVGTLRVVHSQAMLVVSNPLPSAVEVILVGDRGDDVSYQILGPCHQEVCRPGAGTACQTDVTAAFPLAPGRYQLMWRQLDGDDSTSHLGRWALGVHSLNATCLTP
jgi:hypothetical protein